MRTRGNIIPTIDSTIQEEVAPSKREDTKVGFVQFILVLLTSNILKTENYNEFYNFMSDKCERHCWLVCGKLDNYRFVWAAIGHIWCRHTNGDRDGEHNLGMLRVCAIVNFLTYWQQLISNILDTTHYLSGCPCKWHTHCCAQSATAGHCWDCSPHFPSNLGLAARLPGWECSVRIGYSCFCLPWSVWCKLPFKWQNCQLKSD